MQNSITRSLQSWMTWISLSVLIVLVAGCSAARLAYSNGETLSYWWLDAYADFTGEQRPWVKKEIGALFAWHRQTQLEHYIQLLRHAQQRVEGPVDEADLLADYEDAKKRLLVIADQALPQLADLALALDEEQIAHIENKFASKNDEYRKDYLRGNVEKRQAFRFKKLRKQVEYWFGSLSREQESHLRLASDRRPLDNELVLNNRLQRQQALIAMLRKIHAEKPGRNVAMKMIREYIQAVLDRFGNPEHKKFFQETKRETIRIVAGIANSATAEQKEHFQHVTQQWIKDFEALSR